MFDLKEQYDFFISHSGDTLKEAETLYNMLKEINPQWKVFYDKESLQKEEKWLEPMLNAVAHSKYLIFLVKDPKDLLEGRKWVFKEVQEFYTRNASRFTEGREKYCISYFGIVYGSWTDVEAELNADSNNLGLYHSMYKIPNNIVIGANESILNHKNYLKNRVLNIEKRGYNATPQYFLDRSLKYSNQKALNDDNFKKENIIDELIPEFSAFDKKLLKITDIIKLIEGERIESSNLLKDEDEKKEIRRDVMLLGEEGGSGKTTIMTKLYYHFLEKALEDNVEKVMVPIFIEGSSIPMGAYPIKRYLAKHFFDDNIAEKERSSETANYIRFIDNAFSEKNSNPEYILFIDGYNEIAPVAIEEFDSELTEMLSNQELRNIRVVMSGRASLPEGIRERFGSYYIKEISENQILKYLKSKNYTKNINPKLMNILSKPMYLTMFVNNPTENKINTRSDLLMSFLERQLDKDSGLNQSRQFKALKRFALKMLLPYIAYRLCTKNFSLSNFVFTRKELADIIYDGIDYWNSRDFRRGCSEEQFEILSESLDSMGENKTFKDSLNYFTQEAKLIRKDDEDTENYIFIHQVYRDFFASLYIYEDIVNSANEGEVCKALENEIVEKDIIILVAELLKEGKPFFDKTENHWDYSCNDNSKLLKVIGNSRINGQNESPVFGKMITELLKRVRNLDLSGIDFSELDLTKTNLTSLVLSRFDEKNAYPSSFRRAKLNVGNLLSSTPSNHIMAACTNEENVAIFESGTRFNGGVIKIWKKGPFDNNLKKTITGISYKLHKILFSSDNQKIYGMSGHTIVELDASLDEKFGYGEKVIFSVNHKLSNIFKDEEGRLFYTTILNAFNPEQVPMGDEPCQVTERVEFSGINSAASVRMDKKQLVFGHVAGREGFKVFNLNEETGKWQEQKIGIPLLIEECVSEFESFFKKRKLYECFLDKNKNEKMSYHYSLKKKTDFRCLYFKRLAFRHGNDHSDYFGIPNEIYKSIRAEMRERRICIENNKWESFRAELEAIRDKYTEKFTTYEKENRILAYLNGRKITSIEYKNDSDTVFVTYYNNYRKGENASASDEENKKTPVKKEFKCHATVAEIKLSDLSSRLIHIYNGKSIPHAAYCGEDAVIFNNEKIWIADKMERFYGIPVIYNQTIVFFSSKRLSAFYMRVGKYIYEMDENFVPVKSFYAPFKGEEGYALIIDEADTPYIASYKSAKALADDKELKLKVLNLKNGNVDIRLIRGSILPGTTLVDDYYGKRLFAQPGRVNVYKDNILEYSLGVERNLCISGCDFTGITGDMSIPENLDALARHGGITGFERKYPEPVLKETCFDFIRSDKPFSEPEELRGTSSMYTLSEGENYRSTLEINGNDSEEYAGMVWDKIHNACYLKAGFGDSDFSILEKLYYYKFLTPEMVYYFMEAGIIEKPKEQEYKYSLERIKDRMKGPLCSTLRILERFDCAGGRKQPIYTYSNQYGKELLSIIDGMANLENRTRNDLDKNIGKMLVINLWFSYTLMKYKEFITMYDAEVKFDSKYTYLEQGADTILRRLIVLNDTPFFLRLVRGELTEEKINKNKQRIAEFCQVASSYPYVYNYRLPDGFKKPPVIVIIGEDFEYCKRLNDTLKDIAPHIRKIYTYDNLLNYGIKNDREDIYFEFNNDLPYSLSLGELI